MKDIFVLIGPPLSGKETQGKLLEASLGDIPRFSMGNLIREARSSSLKFEEAYQNYSLQGLHLPNDIKFPLLMEKMDKVINTGFILDNFPATEEDVLYLEKYLQDKPLRIKKVILLNVSEDEMRKRFEIAKEKRGRADDTFEIVHERRENQDKDREKVLEHFKKLGILSQINGEQDIEKVHQDILKAINNNES